MVRLKTTKALKFKQKNLEPGTYYKYKVAAYKKNGKKKTIIAVSVIIHTATSGGKVGNYKSIKVNKSVIKLKKKGTFTIKAKGIPQSKAKTVQIHRNIKYESSDTKIAAVSKTGRVKAKKTGKCTIFAYAQNGICKKIKVIVE